MLDIIWIILITYLIILGIVFSFKLKFVNLNIFRMLKSLNKNSFQNLFLSLGTKVGVGSIIGTSIAIYIGGASSIFWIWLFSLITTSLIYIESMLGNKYKQKYSNGYVGGPNFYIKNGLKNKKLSTIYLIILITTYSFFFLMIQTNTIIDLFKINFNINITFISIFLFILIFFITFSSLKECLNLLQKLVPFMCLFLIISSSIIIIKNNNLIILILENIFEDLFNLKSIFSGIIPSALIGIKRNIFQSELLIGTTSIASSINDGDKESVAYSQVLGSLFISFVICTLTAFLILIFDYYNLIDLISYNDLISKVFIFHFGNIGSLILIILILLFAFTTIISGFYFGLNNLLYLTKNKYIILIFRVFVLLFTMSGVFINNSFIWYIIDLMMIILIIINTYSITKLGSEIYDRK